MHTNPSHEKGLSASNAQAPMHTEADCLAPPVRVQRPLSPRQARVLSALLQAPRPVNKLTGRREPATALTWWPICAAVSDW